jgi:phenylacetate-CoA ligase
MDAELRLETTTMQSGTDTAPPVAGQTALPGADLLPRAGIALIRIGLLPLDLLLRTISPRYHLFLWFFLLTPPRLVTWLSRLRASRAADHAARRVPAYRAHLLAHGVDIPDAAIRLELPPTDKATYIDRYPPAARCLGGVIPLIGTTNDESSGSTGRPYNWIRSHGERQASRQFVSHFARYCYGEAPWITINAFSMGAWATGVTMGAALQANSLVKNTGPDLEKIFSTLEYFGTGYRFLICGYPPFLKHLIDIAAERGFPLASYRLMALLGGEGNSEGLRDYLATHFQPIYSGYGATDIEIGVAGETPLSLAIRRLARDDGRVRQALFGDDPRLPMLFQYNPLMHHIETNPAGELIFTITRLNVLAPRIRYNLHDEGGVATFAEMRERLAAAGTDIAGIAAGSGARNVPLPFLWVFGRKDSTVSVMGANIYPEDIEQCLYDEPELARVTHSFLLSLEEQADAAVRPCFAFEIRGEITPALQAAFEERIPARLRALNADYREASQEFAAAAMPRIQLYPLGGGPFARDAARIKQTRLLARSSVAPGSIL